jgi:hypothetical protein
LPLTSVLCESVPMVSLSPVANTRPGFATRFLRFRIHRQIQIRIKPIEAPTTPNTVSATRGVFDELLLEVDASGAEVVGEVAARFAGATVLVKLAVWIAMVEVVLGDTRVEEGIAVGD